MQVIARLQKTHHGHQMHLDFKIARQQKTNQKNHFEDLLLKCLLLRVYLCLSMQKTHNSAILMSMTSKGTLTLVYACVATPASCWLRLPRSSSKHGQSEDLAESHKQGAKK